MSTGSVLTVFTVAALATFGLRALMTLAGNRLTESRHFTEVTAVATPAVLAAMITSSLLLGGGGLARPAAGDLLALVATVVFVRRTGNVSLGLVVGLGVYAAFSVLI